MIKKYSAILLCLVITCALFIHVVSADVQKEQQSFTLSQAVDYALENSPVIKLSNTAVEKANVGYKEAKSAYDKHKSPAREERMLMSPQMLLDSLKMEEGYYKDMAAMGVTLAAKGREQAVETVKMAVQNAYFNLLFAEEKAKIQDSMLDAAMTDMDIAEKKYELGMVSQVDLLSSEAALESAKLGHSTAARDLEYQRMSFNKTLGLPLKTEVSLTDSLTHEEPAKADIEEKATLALQNRYEVISAKEQYENDKRNFELTASWYPENTYTHQQAKHQMESSHHSLVNAEQDVELSVRKAHMDMLSAYEGIKVLGKNVELLQKAYDIARLRYDTGMATSQEVINAHNALRDIKLQHLQTIHGYNLARVQFEASEGIGIAGAGSF